MTRFTIMSAAGLAAILTSDVGYAQSESNVFIDEMARAAITEVHFGKIAVERAQNAEVKAFAERMISDHSRAGEELKQIAADFEITLPTDLDPKHQELATHLLELEGPEFDREYMAAMFNSHDVVAAKIRTYIGQEPRTGKEGRTSPATVPTPPPTTRNGSVASSSSLPVAGEQALNQWATKALPGVEEHLTLARDIRDKLE